MSNLSDQLKRDEGTGPVRNGLLQPYKDSLGYWTLGHGHLIDPAKGGGISARIADIILQDDIAEKASALHKALPWLDVDTSQPRPAALVNMAFQLGVNGILAFHNMLAAYRVGDYENAAKEALNSKWAKQTPERAKRIAKQIRTGEWQ